MIFVAMLANRKEYEILKEQMSNKISMIFIDDTHIENLQNIKFDTLIINKPIKTHQKEFEKICKNARYLLVNSDQNKSIENVKGTIITYGLNHKCTVTASSIKEDSIMVALQREFINKQGKLEEIEEERVETIDNLDVYGHIIWFILNKIYGKSMKYWKKLTFYVDKTKKMLYNSRCRQYGKIIIQLKNKNREETKLDTNYLESNYLTLVGKVTGEKQFSHEIYGERFFTFKLSIARLSGNADIIPITVSERIINDEMLSEGKKLLVKGQFRSYNSYENERNKLILTVFAKDIIELQEEEENEFAKKDGVTNEVVLVGFICKKPIYRQTPFGREIADLLLAVNRAYNKSDYIPSIAWGRNARFSQNLEVGTKVRIVGRVQSRQYEKKFEDGTVETRIAYEVSIGSLEIVDENDTERETQTESVEENQEAV